MKVIWVNANQDPENKLKYEPDGTQEKPYKTAEEAFKEAEKYALTDNVAIQYKRPK